MNFIRYNPETGVIGCSGYMDDTHVQAEIDAGKPTLFATDIYDITAYKVNVQTKQIEPK